MKKLFFIFLLAGTCFAQTISGYFTESPKGSTIAFNQKGYIFGTTGLTRTGSAVGDSSKTISSTPFGVSLAKARNIANQKIFVGVEIDTAFANVNALLTVEISGDGSNWTNLDTLSTDTNPQTLGVTWYKLDMTDIHVPYVRLKFNTSGLKVTTAGYLKFLYAIPL